MSTGSIVAAAKRRAERRVVERLRSAGALDPSRTAPLEGLSPRESRALGSLKAAGAIGEPAPGVYTLDEAAYATYLGRRRVRAGVLVMLALAAVLAALWWTRR